MQVTSYQGQFIPVPITGMMFPMMQNRLDLAIEGASLEFTQYVKGVRELADLMDKAGLSPCPTQRPMNFKVRGFPEGLAVVIGLEVNPTVVWGGILPSFYIGNAMGRVDAMGYDARMLAEGINDGGRAERRHVRQIAALYAHSAAISAGLGHWFTALVNSSDAVKYLQDDPEASALLYARFADVFDIFAASNPKGVFDFQLPDPADSNRVQVTNIGRRDIRGRAAERAFEAYLKMDKKGRHDPERGVLLLEHAFFDAVQSGVESDILPHIGGALLAIGSPDWDVEKGRGSKKLHVHVNDRLVMARVGELAARAFVASAIYHLSRAGGGVKIAQGMIQRAGHGLKIAHFNYAQVVEFHREIGVANITTESARLSMNRAFKLMDRLQ